MNEGLTIPSVIGLTEQQGLSELTEHGLSIVSVTVTGPAGDDLRIVRQQMIGPKKVSIVLAARLLADQQ